MLLFSAFVCMYLLHRAKIAEVEERLHPVKQKSKNNLSHKMNEIDNQKAKRQKIEASN